MLLGIRYVGIESRGASLAESFSSMKQHDGLNGKACSRRAMGPEIPAPSLYGNISRYACAGDLENEKAQQVSVICRWA